MSEAPNDSSLRDIVSLAREEFMTRPEFQASSWAWSHELDDEGFFIFCYLMQDYTEKILSQSHFQETVYTLNLIRHQLLPNSLGEQMGFSLLEQFQILFNLYENLKREKMSWDACEEFIHTQLNTGIKSN